MIVNKAVLLNYAECASPIGQILFASDDHGICALDYVDYKSRMNNLLLHRFGDVELRSNSDPWRLKAQLEKYFDGDLDALNNVPVSLDGTRFQLEVWAALRTIAAGQTATYGELAARLGSPKGARAVGHANSLNPVAIIVPCHRVIGASSALTGYAGGLERKEWLLRHEKRQGNLLPFPYTG